MLRDLGKTEGQPQGLHRITKEFPCRDLPPANHVNFHKPHEHAGRIRAAGLYFCISHICALEL